MSAVKPSTPEKDAVEADTLLAGDLVSDVKQTEKPATQPAIKISTSITVPPPTVATPAAAVLSVESFGIPSLIIDGLPKQSAPTSAPVKEPNTFPFVPPTPVLIVEPNQPPLFDGVKHPVVPIVIVTPSPAQPTNAETNPTEKVTTATVEIQTTSKPTEISTQQPTTTETPTTAMTTHKIVVETSAAPIEILHSSTTAQPIKSSSTEHVISTTTEELVTKIPEPTTEKFENPEPVEPIIIQDLVPIVNESPISALLKVVEEVIDKSQPIVQRTHDEPSTDDEHRSIIAPSTETNDVTPPRPKAFIRSINSDIIKQVSPSAHKFLAAKETAVADLNDMLYKFNYTAGFHGHMEQGDMHGAKNGEYFIIGRDNIMRTVKYTASKHGFVPSIRFGAVAVDEAPKPETEKEFGMRGYEFEWFLERSAKKNAV